MNPSKKLHHASPFVKCKTKRLDSKQKKTIKGTFIAEVNIQEVCDETSDGGSWITASETSKTTDDDVFKSTTIAVSEAEEDIDSPTETFRRSENQQDDAWSLSHMREDSFASPRKGAVDDISPSPKKCSNSDSEETQKSSDRPAGLKIYPVSPYIEELRDFSSMLPYDETNRTVIEYHGERGKESKISQKGSERHCKGIFDSTRIVDPKIDTTVPERFQWCDLSSISSSPQSSQHVPGKKIKSSEKREGILSKQYSEKISLPKGQRKMPFARVKFKHDVPKTIMEETPASFAKEPPNLHSIIQRKNLDRSLLQENKEKLGDTPKSSSAHKFPKRGLFLHGKSRPETTEEASFQAGQFNKDNSEKSVSGEHISTMPKLLDRTYVSGTKESVRTPLLNTFTDNANKTTEVTFIRAKDNNKTKKSTESKLLERKKLNKTKASHDSLNEKRLSEHISTMPKLLDRTYVIRTKESVRTPRLNIFTDNANKTTEVVRKDGNQSKKTEADKLLKRRKNLDKTKARDYSLKEPLSEAPMETATDDIIPTESAESSKAASTKISKKNEAKSSKGPTTLIKDKAKNSSVTALTKKNLRKRREKSLILKALSIVSPSVQTEDSILDFIASTEDEESIEKHSSKISEKNSQAGTNLNDSEDSWKIYPASKVRKRKQTCFKIRKPLQEETEEEIVSTPSSTTVDEDSIDYMDTETEKSNAQTKDSESSTEKYLKEIGLYESEQSTEAESSKLKKRKKKLKKRKSRKESLEEKSLEVRLREYKEYLKTVPICDLSLKKWRDKKEKHEG